MSRIITVASLCLVAAFGVFFLHRAERRSSTPTPPDFRVQRTFEGQPDLQGNWTTVADALTPFERPLPGQAETTTPNDGVSEEEDLANRLKAVTERLNGPTGAGPEHWLEAKLPSGRPSLVIDPPDGRVPALTAQAQTRQRSIAENNRLHANESYQYVNGRCLPRSVPSAIFPTYYNSGVQILQTATEVVLVYEMVHQTRIIPLGDGPHEGPHLRFWMGDSRGHWEGDTLVVDVTNFNGKVGVHGPPSETLHVVERFTRVNQNTINYEATIDDPNVFTRPWKVTFPLVRDDAYEIFEYACHEGNKAVINILSAARLAEKKAVHK
jgi:hypothetical protein